MMAPPTLARKPSIAEIELYQRIRAAEDSIKAARLLLAEDRRAGAGTCLRHAIEHLQAAERPLNLPVGGIQQYQDEGR